MIPSRTSLVVLVLLGLFNLGRGALHAFLPDSGAGAIAHFDLSQGGQTIVFLLATTGAGQIGSEDGCTRFSPRSPSRGASTSRAVSR